MERTFHSLEDMQSRPYKTPQSLDSTFKSLLALENVRKKRATDQCNWLLFRDKKYDCGGTLRLRCWSGDAPVMLCQCGVMLNGKVRPPFQEAKVSPTFPPGWSTLLLITANTSFVLFVHMKKNFFCVIFRNMILLQVIHIHIDR